jgi:23S rRNA (cytidine2498-2'-O)-methyltransferase
MHLPMHYRKSTSETAVPFESPPYAFALLCRGGFEPDLIDELKAWFTVRALSAAVESPQAAVVLVRKADAVPALAELIFARDLMLIGAELPALDNKDRVTPIGKALDQFGPLRSLSVLTPDTEATKPLAPLIGALEARLRGRADSVVRDAGAGLVWMLSGTHALVGQAPAGGGAIFAGGIPRLKFPREAPSRSTLKLDEAFQVLMTTAERDTLLRPGASAVDLGAAPGGWTYQLVMRQIRVTAIDNGRMDGRLLDSGLVQHLREDGFRYRPPRPVDWLVCDMVEKPGRVAELIATWFRAGDCRAAIFNLKLPMKRRFEAWNQAFQQLQALRHAGFSVRARQLYHDREEITVAVIPTGTVSVRTAAAARTSRSTPRPAPVVTPKRGRQDNPARPAAAATRTTPSTTRGARPSGKKSSPQRNSAAGPTTTARATRTAPSVTTAPGKMPGSQRKNAANGTPLRDGRRPGPSGKQRTRPR